MGNFDHAHNNINLMITLFRRFPAYFKASSCFHSVLLNDRFFTKEHEWISYTDNEATVGLTDHAQLSIGEIIFINIEKVDKDVNKNDAVGVIESSKAAIDIYAPVSGHILEMNPQLAKYPTLLNQDPYGKGWVFKMKLHNNIELKDFMLHEDYL
ncbi:hypothetical protein HZS_3056, partial [Henneguya salminicola]